jgi:hypothetical protein
MTDSSDYPAAHSMDTMWFAVDTDGNVAVFDSGEAGAVPVDGYVGEEHYDLLETVRSAGHRSRVIWEVSALLGTHAGPGLNGGQTTFILVLSPAGTLAAELERAGGRRIEASGLSGGALAFMVDKLSHDLHEKLHETSVCLGCEWHFGDEEENPDPASFGLYHYEHSCENWISGPYQLATRPAQPLRADALPPEVAEHLVHVDRPFRDTTRLNPPEHWHCESWEPAWLDSDGKTVHPFPGREDELANVAENLGPEFVLAGGKPPASRAAPEPASGNGNGTAQRKPWWKFW